MKPYLDPSGDAGDLLQLGVYRHLPRERNHTFSTSLNHSGEGGGVLQLGVYRDLPRKKTILFLPYSIPRETLVLYDTPAPDKNLGQHHIFLPVLIPREMPATCTIRCV